MTKKNTNEHNKNNKPNKTKRRNKKGKQSGKQTDTHSETQPKCKAAFEPFERKVDQLFKKNNIDITSANYNLEKEVIKDLKKAVNTSNIKPTDDFYSYINDRWIKNETINHGYIIQIDDFRLIQDQVYRQINELLQRYVSDPTHNSAKDKCIKHAYKSFQTFHTLSETRRLATQHVEAIDAIISSNDNMWHVLAHLNMNEIVSWGAPFVWSINPDDKDPTRYICSIESPQLSLIDIDVYFNDDTDTTKTKQYKANSRMEYLAYLNSLFEIAFGANHGYDIIHIYECEVDIVTAMGCNLMLHKHNNNDGYNVITREEAVHDFGFDWPQFCKALGFKQVPASFVTSNVNYLLCGTKMLKDQWTMPKWRTYCIYIYIRQQTRWNEIGFLNYVDFFGKYLRGQDQAVDMEIRPVFLMGFAFNTFVTNQYVSNYEDTQSIEYVRMIADDLKTVFKRIVTRNTWMHPKTKRTALDKLEHITFQIGHPPVLSDDPILDYQEHDPWGNLVKMALWRHQRAVEMAGKPVIDMPAIDWTQTPPKFVSSQAYIVNAMYTPTTNSIYVPLGYIQKPFVDLNQRGFEYNLAHIGFTIAHELSHALDDFGSKYNKHGQLDDWWTDHDKRAYSKIQQDIIKEYETFALRDHIHFDARASIGEDLADISGFGICQEYLRDFQQKNNTILPIQSLSFETFFVYFALQSRQKISKKAILAQLKTNPHPLDKYRCNVPLSRSAIFRAIYNVQKTDSMWWNKTGNIWS